MLLYLLFLSLIPPTTALNIKDIKCSAVGINHINISWQALTNPRNYSYAVYFRKSSCFNPAYFHGCSLNSTENNQYSCNIASAVKLKFPEESEFCYFIKVINGDSVKDSQPMICAVNMIMKCTDPVVLSLGPFDTSRSLTLRWHHPVDMGESNKMCGLLCYRIVYGIVGSENKVKREEYMENCSFTMKSLLPYRMYSVSVQCSIDCSNLSKWSNQVGPLLATTQAEMPQGTIIFEKYESHRDSHNNWSRYITVYFKLPDKEKWNGNISHVRVFNCSPHTCENITVPPTEKSVLFHSLRSDAEYVLQAEYCNTKGCSPKSSNLTIKKDIVTPSSENTGTRKAQAALKKKTVNDIIIAVCTVIGIMITAAIIIILVWRHRRKNHSLQSLAVVVGDINVQPQSSDSEDNNDGSIDPTSNEYALARCSIDPTSSEYAYARCSTVSRATLNAETADFHSASARSLNSFNMSGVLPEPSLTMAT